MGDTNDSVDSPDNAEDTSVNDLLRNADILMASLNEYCRETEQRQREEQEQREEAERERERQEANAAAAAAVPINVEVDRVARVVLNDIAIIDSTPSTSRASSSNSSLDDSVVFVGGAAQLDTIKPIGPKQDEDVIFVTEVRQPYRTLATIDLCDSFEGSPKKTTAPDNAECGPSPAKKTCNNSQSPKKSTMGTTKCPICLDMFTMDQILSTMCGHLFCGPCIQSVIKSRKKCPMCNRGLKPNQVHRLFIDPNM